MIGLDTNVLVRYLTQDDPLQAECANRLIEAHCTRERPGHVAIVVLCELVWVLRGAYRYDKAVVIDVLEQILLTAEFQVGDEDVASQALAAYRHGAADFADYVIVYANRAAGCETMVSFDQKLTEHKYVQAPE